ncbi:Hypothetical protein PHPALM_9532 [Phytophthora palmivora]|uniref:Uncharacterized protein n=1 Tax=Phytophthora palmivora TaxID=4796 RepID=A0A2P4Y723_9STRA|nr:Hypothetical protein PHPALM_9532 [Phytophthora palmivora]
MEEHRQLSKSSAHDERGYGSVNPGTVHHKAAKKPRTTYAPAVVDPRSQQPSDSQPGAGLPAPTSSMTRDKFAHSQAAGASQSAAALGRPAPHGNPSFWILNFGSGLCGVPVERRGPSASGSRKRDRDNLGRGPGCQTVAQAGMPGALEVLRQVVDVLGRETQELHWRVDLCVPVSALIELRRVLDVLTNEVRGRMPSYEPHVYLYHAAHGMALTSALPVLYPRIPPFV